MIICPRCNGSGKFMVESVSEEDERSYIELDLTCPVCEGATRIKKRADFVDNKLLGMFPSFIHEVKYCLER